MSLMRPTPFALLVGLLAIAVPAVSADESGFVAMVLDANGRLQTRSPDGDILAVEVGSRLREGQVLRPSEGALALSVVYDSGVIVRTRLGTGSGDEAEYRVSVANPKGAVRPLWFRFRDALRRVFSEKATPGDADYGAVDLAVAHSRIGSDELDDTRAYAQPGIGGTASQAGKSRQAFPGWANRRRSDFRDLEGGSSPVESVKSVPKQVARSTMRGGAPGAPGARGFPGASSPMPDERAAPDREPGLSLQEAPVKKSLPAGSVLDDGGENLLQRSLDTMVGESSGGGSPVPTEKPRRSVEPGSGPMPPPMFDDVEDEVEKEDRPLSESDAHPIAESVMPGSSGAVPHVFVRVFKPHWAESAGNPAALNTNGSALEIVLEGEAPVPVDKRAAHPAGQKGYLQRRQEADEALLYRAAVRTPSLEQVADIRNFLDALEGQPLEDQLIAARYFESVGLLYLARDRYQLILESMTGESSDAKSRSIRDRLVRLHLLLGDLEAARSIRSTGPRE